MYIHLYIHINAVTYVFVYLTINKVCMCIYIGCSESLELYPNTRDITKYFCCAKALPVLKN